MLFLRVTFKPAFAPFRDLKWIILAVFFVFCNLDSILNVLGS